MAWHQKTDQIKNSESVHLSCSNTRTWLVDHLSVSTEENRGFRTHVLFKSSKNTGDQKSEDINTFRKLKIGENWVVMGILTQELGYFGRIKRHCGLGRPIIGGEWGRGFPSKEGQMGYQSGGGHRTLKTSLTWGRGTGNQSGVFWAWCEGSDVL